MRRKASALLLASLLLASVLGALGCETVKGLGKDIENLGQEIQK